MKEALNKWRSVDRRLIRTETNVFDRIYMFLPRPLWRVLRESTVAVQVSYILLSKGRYWRWPPYKIIHVQLQCITTRCLRSGNKMWSLSSYCVLNWHLI